MTNPITWALKKIGYEKQSKKSINLVPQSYTYNMNTAIFPSYTIFKDYDAYSSIDEVYSVISFLAETAARIDFFGYEVKNDQAMKSYVRKSQNSILGKFYRTKALADVPESDQLAVFLKSLSYEQKVLWYTMLYVCGEIFLYKEIEDVGPNAGRLRLHVLNAQCMTLIISQEFPQRITSYKYQDGFFEGTFTTDEIIHIKYPNPTYVNGMNWRGLSPLSVFSKKLTRMKAAMDTSVAQVQNGGVPGIVYEKDVLDVETINQRKDNFASYLRNSANKGAPYFAGGEMGYIQLGISLQDLGLTELTKADQVALCNLFKVPITLMNDTSASTDNNMGWSEKRMYTSSILPNVFRVRDALNIGALPVFGKDKKRYIEEDISTVEVLQEDLQKQTDALSKQWWVTGNEKREIQGYDLSDDPAMNEIIIPSGHMLLSDLSAPPDLNLTDGQNQPANSRQGNQQN